MMKKILKVIITIFAKMIVVSLYVILIFAFLGSVFGLVHAITTKDKGVEVEAVISDVSSRKYVTRHGLKTEYYAYVDYSYKGKEYHEHYQYYYSALKKGDKITITINKDNPKDILSYKDELVTSIGGLLIFVILGIFIVISEINKHKLKKLGIDVKDRKAVEAYVREQKMKKRERINKINKN